MSDEIKVTRPQQSAAQSTPMPVGPKSSSGGSKMPWIVLAVVVLVLLVVGALFRDKLFNKGSKTMTQAGKTGSYQAVFLTNGQVYFGRIADVHGDYVTLADIYYLQVVQQPIQGTPQGQQQQAQQQISLVKLGNELHGPVDEMHISRSQILFYEDLKNDGNVVKAIDQYKANPTGATVPAQQTPIK